MPAKSEKQAKFMRAVAHSPEFAKKVGVPQSVGKEFTMKKKPVKKMAVGGTSTSGTQNTSAARNQARYDQMSSKFGSKVANMQAKGNPNAAAARSRFDARLGNMRSRFGIANPAARDPGVGTGGAGEEKVLGGNTQQEAYQPAKKGGVMKKATKFGAAMTKKSADTKGRAMVKKAMGGKCYAKGGTADPKFGYAGAEETRFKYAPARKSTLAATGTAEPRPMMKKGGKIVKKAAGGTVGKADGVAKKGKTHTKMVAMKKGGYMKGGKC